MRRRRAARRCSDEVMAVLRALLDGKQVDHEWAHLRIEGARLTDPELRHPVPLYFGGALPRRRGGRRPAGRRTAAVG
ncbi:hypothetical protein ACFWSF_02205 [Streptomyces sp. NPDC058611]|uniref:hypothetical protein n=1 Tax=unclassified Streptomyces TaxID=2593676 RepID=UPI00366A1E30